MKVKIIKAARPTYWYADKIGKVFEVSKIPTHDRYPLAKTYEDHRAGTSFIDVKDCRRIDIKKFQLEIFAEKSLEDFQIQLKDAKNQMLSYEIML